MKEKLLSTCYKTRDIDLNKLVRSNIGWSGRSSSISMQKMTLSIVTQAVLLF